MIDAIPHSAWFSRTDLPGGIVWYSEPHVHPYLRANIYFVPGYDCDLVIDTGMGLATLRPELPENPRKPLVAVATHIHLDHVGSLHEFGHRFGPRASGAEFAIMPPARTYENALREIDDPLAGLPHEGFAVGDYRIEPAALTRLLSEGDRVETGDRVFRVVELPGHSPDSIGLIDESDGLFFSGDAIYDDTLIDDLPDSNRAVYRETMRRILELPARLVLGGHGEPFDGERMREIAREYLRKV